MTRISKEAADLVRPEWEAVQDFIKCTDKIINETTDPQIKKNMNELKQYAEGERDIFGPVIYSYSRADAINDGVLVDVSTLAKEAGIKYPVAVTARVHALLDDCQAPGQDYTGRAWDMFTIFKLYARRAEGDAIHFAPIFRVGRYNRAIKLWAKIGPGDTPAPVITIMMEDED